MKLIALKSLRYPAGTFGGKRYEKGDTFEAKDRDVKLLVGAKIAAEAPKRAAPVYRTASVTAERAAEAGPVVPDVATDADRPKRQYRRRDLKAEG